MTEYRDRYAELQSAGVDVAALSVDAPASSAALREELKLPFTLLCDTERAAVKGWDLLNTREHGGIAYPAVFVLGPDRKVRYRSLDDTAARVHADSLLEFLRSGNPDAATAPKKRGYFPHFSDIKRALRNFLRFGVRSTPR